MVAVDLVEATVRLGYNIFWQVRLLLHHVDGRPVRVIFVVVVFVCVVVVRVVTVWVVLRTIPCRGRVLFICRVFKVNRARSFCVGRGVWWGLAQVNTRKICRLFLRIHTGQRSDSIVLWQCGGAIGGTRSSGVVCD
jgi:hypothetical protein